MKLVSTKRIDPNGVVHEMAPFGSGTFCDLDLPAPWQWTDKRITCPTCRRTTDNSWMLRHPIKEEVHLKNWPDCTNCGHPFSSHDPANEPDLRLKCAYDDDCTCRDFTA